MLFHQYFYASNQMIRKKFKKYATQNCCKILKSTKVTKQRSITFTTGLAHNTLPNLTMVSDRSRPMSCFRGNSNENADDLPDPRRVGSDCTTGMKRPGWLGGLSVRPPPAGISSSGGWCRVFSFLV